LHETATQRINALSSAVGKRKLTGGRYFLFPAGWERGGVTRVLLPADCPRRRIRPPAEALFRWADPRVGSHEGDGKDARWWLFIDFL